MNKKFYYVTNNAGKFEEVRDFFDKVAPSFHVEQYAIDIDEIQSLDQKIVVKDKIKKAFNLVKQPLLLDDGGLFFSAYKQFPGTLSKFVFKGLGFKVLLKLF